MLIPYTELSEDALLGLIEDFVTREGTDYGDVEMSRQEKAQQLLALLKSGELLISYNEDTETCGLVPRDQASKAGLDDD